MCLDDPESVLWSGKFPTQNMFFLIPIIHRIRFFLSLVLVWKGLFYAVLLQIWQFCNLCTLSGKFLHEKCCFPKSYRFSGFWRNHCCLPEFLLSFLSSASFICPYTSFIHSSFQHLWPWFSEAGGGRVCARRKVLQRMEWALTLRPMDKWDPHRTPSEKRDPLKKE